MNSLGVVGLLIVLGALGLAVILMARRPRTATEVLDKTRAKINASGLRGVIEVNVRKRSSGILSVSSEGQVCSIAFLFGHVFHARCGSIVGEEALRMALAWHHPDLSFDTKTKMPVEETITRPIDDMLREL